MAKRKSKTAVYLLLVITLCLIAVSLFLIFGKDKPLEVKEFDVVFGVKENGVGLDVNTSVLTFGYVSRGFSMTRNVYIEDGYNFPLRVDVLLSKNLMELIKVDTGFVVQPGENVTIPVRLEILDDFPTGNYTGKIRFEMYKSK